MRKPAETSYISKPLEGLMWALQGTSDDGPRGRFSDDGQGRSNPRGVPPTPGQRPFWHYLATVLAALFFWSLLFQQFNGSGPREIAYSTFKQQVSQGKVAQVTFEGEQIHGRYVEPSTARTGSAPSSEQAAVSSHHESSKNASSNSGSSKNASSQNESSKNGSSKSESSQNAESQSRTDQSFVTTKPQVDDPKLLDLLEKHHVTIKAEAAGGPWWARVLIGILPWVLILGLFFYLSYRMQKRMSGGDGPGGIFSFGKSKAKRFRETSIRVGLDDVAGLENAKQDLQEIIENLAHPERYQGLGAKIPRGVLLVGPPGTGKTLLARAVAGEAGVPFYNISGSEFVEMFVGVGAARVRDMFESAKKEAPCVIFIDEIDAVGRSRGTGIGGGHDEREQTLNQILSEMDGFTQNQNLVVLAATNRPDVLDPALLRPGRFDRKVFIELPDRQARAAILRVHMRHVPLAEDVDVSRIAGRTIGFSGADLENLVNEAALLAGRKQLKQVDMGLFEAARDKLVLGAERERGLQEDERRLVAYHESGHALMAWLLPEADPLEKVSIIPHGRALGVTEQLPEEERHNLKRSYLIDRIGVMLGGRVAEQVVFNDVTSGAESDLEQATRLARRMVSRWGMDEAIGPVAFKSGEDHVFLGREIAQSRDFSDATAKLIDDEVRHLLEGQEQRVHKLMQQHRDKLQRLAEALLEEETIGHERVHELFETHVQASRPTGTG
jgi:cell division protease FtsH